MVYSFTHLYSRKWWNGAIGNNLWCKNFFQNICNPLVHRSIMKIKNTITAGINIQILIFNKYAVDAINHHRQKAQLSHINTLAGLILKNMKATRVEIHTPNTVVARYLWDMNRATAKVSNTNMFNHHASQSSQSVIFTALTMNIVAINVNIGNPHQRCTTQNNGDKSM